MGRTVTACLAMGWLFVIACGDPDGGETIPISIPGEHPCPGWALAPEGSSQWTEARASGEPVPLTLLPPLDEGLEVPVSQGPDQEPSHTDSSRWAWDLDVPVGTRVLAAAPGVVVYVRDDSDTHGADVSFASDANLVTLDHGGGLYTSYVHLEPGSAEVSAGEQVSAGQLLALTGLSGQLTGPHLHFQVENIWSDSLPARLVEPSGKGCERSPNLGDRVRRPGETREHLVGAMTVSPVPEDTFAEGGVVSITGLPGRLMGRGETYQLSGATASGLESAWVLIFPETGGDALMALSMPVVEQGFSGSLSLSGLAPGAYGWAAVATPGEDPVAERSVRFTLVD